MPRKLRLAIAALAAATTVSAGTGASELAGKRPDGIKAAASSAPWPGNVVASGTSVTRRQANGDVAQRVEIPGEPSSASAAARAAGRRAAVEVTASGGDTPHATARSRATSRSSPRSR